MLASRFFGDSVTLAKLDLVDFTGSFERVTATIQNTAGWNKPKFEHAFSHIESKTKQEFEDAHGGPMTMDEFKIRIIAEYKTLHAK